MNYETNTNVLTPFSPRAAPLDPALHVIAAFIYLFRAVIFNYPPGCVRMCARRRAAEECGFPWPHPRPDAAIADQGSDYQSEL